MKVNKEQFINIIREHRSLIYKVCHSYCRDPADHPDLEQEIFVQLWGAMPRYDASVKMSTWIYRIALNTAITWYRKERKRRNIDRQAFLTLATYQYDKQTDDQIQQLYQFIDRLHFLDKALMLLYLDDTRHRDIAEILGISESNVATKISRIKEKLKRQFQISK